MSLLPTLFDTFCALAALAACGHMGRQAGWRLGGTSPVDRAVIGFTVVTGWFTLGGYVLGAAGLLASRPAWMGLVALGAVLAGRPAPWRWRPGRWRRGWRLLIGRPHLGIVAALVIWMAAANLALVLFAAPNNWDAMLYHLTRVGYYLQQGSFDAYGANFYSQEQLGRNSAVLLAGLLTICGRADTLAGLPQFIAWLAGGAAVVATARTWQVRPAGAAFAGAVWMLLSIAWLEAVTAQNDVLIAAHFAAAFFFLRRFALVRAAAQPPGGATGLPWLVLAGAAIGLAIGTKASALTVMPALLIAAGRCAWRPWPWPLGIAALASLPFVLPSGYLDNLRRHGNPLGTEAYREHVYHDVGAGDRLASALRNALRFSFDFATLDQAPPLTPVARALAQGKRPVAGALATIGLDLESKADVRMDFWVERLHFADDNLSWFGPFGIFVLAGYVVAWRRRRWRFLAISLTVFFALQCLAGPYDSIRGRQMLYAAGLALPALAWWAGRWGRRGRLVATGLVAIAALHVVPASLLRNNHFLFPHEGRRAFWQKDRVEQMNGFHASYPAHRAFAERVPLNARVGVALSGYEYPLFGPRLTRTLVPLARRTRDGTLDLANLDWLVFDRTVLAPQPGDIDLGAGWFLRKLGD